MDILSEIPAKIASWIGGKRPTTTEAEDIRVALVRVGDCEPTFASVANVRGIAGLQDTRSIHREVARLFADCDARNAMYVPRTLKDGIVAWYDGHNQDTLPSNALASAVIGQPIGGSVVFMTQDRITRDYGNVPEQLFRRTQQRGINKRIPVEISSYSSSEVPEKISGEVPDKTPEKTLEKIPEEISEEERETKRPKKKSKKAPPPERRSSRLAKKGRKTYKE